MRFPWWNIEPLCSPKRSLLVKKFLWWPMRLYQWPYSSCRQWRWLETAHIVYMKDVGSKSPDTLKPAYWIKPELYDDSGLPRTKGCSSVQNMFYA